MEQKDKLTKPEGAGNGLELTPEHLSLKPKVMRILQKLKIIGPDTYDKEHANAMLCRSKDPRVAGYILQGMKDNNAIIRMQVVHALAKMDADVALIGLRRAVRDINAEVRAAAMYSLGNLKDSRDEVMGMLKKGLHDSEVEVREAAVENITKLGGPKAFGLLRKAYSTENEPSVREMIVCDGAAKFGKQFKNILMDALFDPDPMVVNATKDVLAQNIDKETLLVLVRKFKDGTPEMRKTIRDLIWEVGDRVSMKYIQLIEEPHRYAEEFILASLGDKHLKSLPSLPGDEEKPQ